MAYKNIVTTLPQQITNDTEFRNLGSTIRTELGNMGLVRTGDTGQIDWTTVTKPGAIGTVAGYEIWRFADSLQSTNPIYIKIEYGTSGNSALSFSMWLQLATGSNGAGTLTGPLSTRRQVSAGNNQSATPSDILFSGDTDRFLIAFFYNNGSPQAARCMFISVERELNANGTRSGNGAYVSLSNAGGSNTNPIAQEYYSRIGGGGTFESDPGVMVPAFGNGTSGADVAVYPQFLTNGVFLPPGLNWFAYFNTAIPRNTQVSFNVYGATRTYFTLGSDIFNAAGIVSRGGSAGVTVMVRYE